MVKEATSIAEAGVPGSRSGPSAAVPPTPLDGDEGATSPLAIIREALEAGRAWAGGDPFRQTLTARALESLKRIEGHEAALERIAALHLHTAECYGHMNYATCRRTDSLRHAVQMARDALEG